MNRYPLSGDELSPYCRGYWDETNKKFLDTNSVDVINCCMESCKDRIKFCFDKCDKTYGNDSREHQRCYKQCDELITDCEDGCMEIKSEGLNIVNECAKSTGCGTFPLFNSTCLENNRETIVGCCNKKCATSQSTDCDHDFCEDFYKHLTGSIQFPLEDSYKLGKYKPSPKKYTYIYPILIFSGVLIILLIWFHKK